MLLSIWSALWDLVTLLSNNPNPEDLSSAEPDRGHGMDPDG